MAREKEGREKRTWAWFEGRYGYDSLGRTLLLLAFALGLCGFATKNVNLGDVLYIAALTLLFFEVMRLFSKNTEQRGREYETYDAFTRHFRYLFYRLITSARGGVVLDWEQYKLSGRRDVRYLLCPRCQHKIIVPPNRGKLTLKCRKCGKIVQTKS